MRNGLYRVHFETRIGGGGGVVTLNDGKVGGGDSAIYYVGTYSENGNQFTGEVLTDRHSPGMPSVFGVDKLQISLKGTTDGDKAQITGTSQQAPGLTLHGTLTRLAD